MLPLRFESRWLSDKWYNHVPKPVLETETSKILWDFKIHTDKQIEADKLGVVLLDKEDRKYFITNIACPFDTRIGNNQKEKVEKYQHPSRELQRIWKCKSVEVVPIVIGALGTLPRDLMMWQGIIDAADIKLPTESVCAGFCKNFTEGPGHLNRTDI